MSAQRTIILLVSGCVLLMYLAARAEERRAPYQFAWSDGAVNSGVPSNKQHSKSRLTTVAGYMLRNAAAIGLGSQIHLSPSTGDQNADSLLAYDAVIKQVTENVIRNIRVMVRRTINAEQRKTEQDIDYRVPSEGLVNAYATKEDDKRVIVIPTGVVTMMEFVTNAYIADAEFAYKGCYQHYVNVLVKSYFDNTYRKASNKELTPPPTVLSHARDTSGPCDGLTYKAFEGNEVAATLKAGFMDASIAFVVLHELAHHLLGHVGSRSESNKDQREKEAEADLWAMEHALDMGVLVTPAMPVLYFFAVTEDNTTEAELRASHPLAVRRMLALVEFAQDALNTCDSDYCKSLSKSGGLEGTLDGFKEQKRWFKQALDHMP